MNALTKRMLGVTTAIVVWWSFGIAWAFGQSAPNLPYQLERVAAKIHSFLQREGFKEGVALGEFQTPKKAAINPGPGMFQILERELRELKVDTSPGGKLRLDGDFRLHDAGEGKREAELIWKLVDGDKTVFIVNVNLTNAEDVDLFFPPPAVIDGTKVRARRKSPLSAEILVGDNAREPSYSKDYKPKMAFVGLQDKDEFAVRLHNSSKFCMAVLLKLDAVNVFAYSGPDRDWRVIVPPNEAVTITGWHRKDDLWDDFGTTGFPKSMRKNQNLPPDDSHVGVVTMSYRYCRRVGYNDPKPPGIAGAKAQSTGRLFIGKSGKKSQRQISEVRSVMGPPEETVIIRFSK